jgi:AcrR family transcriptional regulator
MSQNTPDASHGEADDAPAQRPRTKLARIREEGLHEDPELRERIMEATLVAAAELGYRRSTVAAVAERFDGYRVQFYRLFGNLGEAYELAHATHLERLAERLLAAGAAAPGWRAGLRAALAELGGFARERPQLARGLLIEVHVAGGPALGKRQEVLERLSSALDSARRETGSRHSPPPLTAPFMVSAIESAVAKALAKGEPERFQRAAPELEQLVSCAYFGQGALRSLRP